MGNLEIDFFFYVRKKKSASNINIIGIFIWWFNMKNEIVWLSQSRIKDRKTIMKHIQNIYKDIITN